VVDTEVAGNGNKAKTILLTVEAFVSFKSIEEL
jgi:hypothetical protein